MVYEEAKLQNYVVDALSDDRTGHDSEHTLRVKNNSLSLARYYEEADRDILVASCLLHDIAFAKGFVEEHWVVGAKLAPPILESFDFPEEKIPFVSDAILYHAGHLAPEHKKKPNEHTIEEKLLIDGDNLDALGAVGIIRAINFANSRGWPYIINEDDGLNTSAYGTIKAVTKWGRRMMTPEGGELAERRIVVMREFLRQLRIEISTSKKKSILL